jgi:hypothetical protein
MPAKGEFPLDQLLGKIAPAGQAQKGMVRAEEELARRFERRQAGLAASTKAFSPFAEAFGRQNAEQLQRAVRSLQELDKRAGREKVSVPRLAPDDERVFPGSIGITRVPPYNYQWTWSAKDNNSATASVAATAANGQQSFNLWNSSVQAHAWGATAVGIYFRPFTTNGIVHLWANPAINYNWWTYCTLASAHSDGWLGLYVGQYTLAGDLDHVPVDQQISLWSDDSWWGGAGSHSGSNSGYPLSSWFTVDSNHWYAMWVWTGGSIYGSGWGTFSGSGAGASMKTGTPSISLVLY